MIRREHSEFRGLIRHILAGGQFWIGPDCAVVTNSDQSIYGPYHALSSRRKGGDSPFCSCRIEAAYATGWERGGMGPGPATVRPDP
jgi:hypothetical protein